MSWGSAAASAPSVVMPMPRSLRSVASPMPLMARTGSGARKDASVPGGTTVRPRGFWRSEPILATVLLTPSPMEQVMPSSDTRPWMRRQISMGLSLEKRPGVTSKNASSTETCSMSGVSSRMMDITWFDISR